MKTAYVWTCRVVFIGFVVLMITAAVDLFTHDLPDSLYGCLSAMVALAVGGSLTFLYVWCNETRK